VDSLVTGLILSSVNGKGMTVIVGIIVGSIITWLVVTFGIRWFHHFERWAWIPQLVILFILIGVAGPKFDTTTPSKGSGATLAGNRMSFVFLSASGALGWSATACDFFVYFPEKTNRWMIFSMTAIGLGCGKMIVELIGIGLGSGLFSNPTWLKAFKAHSSGGVIVEAFKPLGTFGNFCAVVMALGVVANNIPGIYSAALSFQIALPELQKIPRVFWSSVSVIIFTVCAIAGRQHLLQIFINFLSLVGYWTIIWISITAEEQIIFRRKRGYNWADWNTQSLLPVGLAAFSAFAIGWVGAIICMDQEYYTGPIAKLVGDGADMGLPVAASFAAITYPTLRYIELKHFGR